LSILKIIRYGHPHLREKAFDIKKADSRLRDLIQAMAETMYAAPGVGLAAPQVGVLERLFLVDVDYDRQDPNVEETRNLHVFINPEIIEESQEDEPYTEGCLSIPGIEAEVYRPSRIVIAARDENFEPFEAEADGLLARVIQHENDHLNGILFVDKVPILKRSVLGGQLNRMKREVLEELKDLGPAYPIEIEV
jgi:peptide deformylase